MEPELATQMISPLGDNVIERNRRFAHMKVVTRKSFTKPIFEWRGLPAYHFGDDGNGYYIQYSPEKNEVLYFVAYKMIKDGGIRFGRQILVWADRSNPSAFGLPAHTFWKILLPKFKALIADTPQTEAGAMFWRQRLGECFDRKYGKSFAYAYDRRSSPTALHPMSEDDRLLYRSALLWGKDEGNLRTPAVIASQELKLRP